MNINENVVLLLFIIDKLHRHPIMPKNINIRNPKISQIDSHESPIFETTARPKNFASLENELTNPIVICCKKGKCGSIQ
jgi:hypothetical protein